MKPRVVLFSNCVGGELARFFNMVPAFTRHFDAVFVRNWAVRKGFSAIDPADFAGCHILLTQLRQLEDADGALADIPVTGARATFAAFTMQPLWPTFVHVQRPGYRDDRCLNGQFPFGDSLALQLLRQGLTPDEAYDAYLRTDFTSHFDLARIASIAESKLATLNGRSDIDLWPVLGDAPYERRRFRNALYPTHETILLMGHLILRSLGLGDVPADVSRAFLLSAPPWRMHIPIHPQVIEHFGLTWTTPESRCDYMEGASLTFHAYLRAYLHDRLPSVSDDQQRRFAGMQALAPWARTVPVTDHTVTSGTETALVPDDSAQLLAALRQPLAGARVLDIDPAEGMLATAAAARGASVVALARDAHHAAQVAWMARERGVTVEVYVAADATNAVMPPCDVVCCARGLGHLADPVATLTRCHASGASELVFATRTALQRTDATAETDPVTGECIPSPQLLASWLLSAGFTGIDLVHADAGATPRTIWRASRGPVA